MEAERLRAEVMPAKNEVDEEVLAMEEALPLTSVGWASKMMSLC